MLYMTASRREKMDYEETPWTSRGLDPRMEVCLQAPVILIHNLAVKHGLMNGSFGKVKHIQFSPGDRPDHADFRRRMPAVLVVDFPGYKGPAFYDDPARRTWVPVMPATSHCDTNATITRTQFPLTLGWALTPWKAQGMTLDKAIVKLGNKASQPGVCFTALSRVRHVDDLMLDDDFPSMQIIMSQTNHPSFRKRLVWEKYRLADFSRTLRHHMRQQGSPS